MKMRGGQLSQASMERLRTPIAAPSAGRLQRDDDPKRILSVTFSARSAAAPK
jgi:hypothetical protein